MKTVIAVAIVVGLMVSLLWVPSISSTSLSSIIFLLIFPVAAAIEAVLENKSNNGISE